MEESELAERCKEGDRNAQKVLYEQYAGKILAICLRYAPDRPSAEDLLHDTFIKLFNSFDKFTWRGKGSLRAWMERVTINTALQYLRKNQEMWAQNVSIDNVPNIDEEPAPEEVQTIPQSVLLRFISELPKGYRTVFNLYTFEDKSHKEIAQILGINEKSSASQLSRAKVVLAQKIKKWIQQNQS